MKTKTKFKWFIFGVLLLSVKLLALGSVDITYPTNNQTVYITSGTTCSVTLRWKYAVGTGVDSWYFKVYRLGSWTGAISGTKLTVNGVNSGTHTWKIRMYEIKSGVTTIADDDKVTFVVTPATYSITARNNFSGGQIKVGVNNSPITIASPYIFSATVNNTVNLEAIDNQSNGGYTRIWNDNDAPENKSEWRKSSNNGSFTPYSNNKVVSFTVNATDKNAIYQSNLRKICNVTQKYEFIEGGTSGTQLSTTRIEGNTITITAAPTKTSNGITGYFYGWKEDVSTSTTLTKTINSHSTFTAQYKAVAHSNNINAYKNGGQRKIVKAENGTMFRVYESMNRIWLEKSTDGSNTWVLANNHKPISYLQYGENPSSRIDRGPSIAIDPDNYGSNFYFYIIYTRQIGSNKDLVVIKADANGNQYDYGYVPMDCVDNKPVIAVDNEKIMVVSKQSGSSGYSTLTFNPENFDFLNLLDEYVTHVPNTNENSCNATLACNYKIVGSYVHTFFHFAWQQGTSSVGSEIKYIRPNPTADDDGYSCVFYDYKVVSTDVMPLDGHITPSITCAFDTQPTIAWVNKTLQGDFSEVHIRTKNSGTSWGTETHLTSTYEFDTPISVSINTLEDGYNDYMVAYVADIDKVKFYIADDPEDPGEPWHGYITPYNYDNYVQLSSGDEYDDAIFETFKTNSSPYVIHSSTVEQSLSKSSNRKGSATNGRELILTKGSTKLRVRVEAPTVDGEQINFVNIDDTTVVETKEEALSLLTTEEFELSNKSNFSFNLSSLVANESKEAKSISADIKLNVVLLDAKSNEQLGLLKEVSSKKLTKEDKGGLSYKVNTKGIGNRTVKLLVSLDPKTVDDIVIAKTSTLNGDKLNKDNQIEVALDKDLMVTEYALSQNYPNPFNPSTTINYQIPKDGFVSLKVYDITGQEVMTLVNKEQSIGKYNVTFDASSLSSGVYLYRIQSGSFAKSMKMILLK